jgi:hypothetical protein
MNFASLYKGAEKGCDYLEKVGQERFIKIGNLTVLPHKQGNVPRPPRNA